MTSYRTMLYVSCGGTQKIVRFAMDSTTGELFEMGNTVLPGASAASIGPEARAAPELRSNGAPLTVNPEGTLLYAATRTEPCSALSYRISPEDGDLALIGEAPIQPGTPYIATDRSGHFLLGAAYHANAVWVSRTDAKRAVAAPPTQIIEDLGTTHCVMVHSSNKVAYVASTGRSSIQIFDFVEDRLPLSNRRDAVSSAADATPRHLAMHPDERFLYCMNETTSIVDVFATGEGGRELTPVQSVDLRPPSARDTHGLGADIMVSPNGRWLYCTERMRGTLSVLAIDRLTGFLTVTQSLEAGTIPRSIAMEPAGRFLACAMQGDGIIQMYAVSPDDGRLDKSATYETGGTPIWVEFVQLPVAA